MIDFTDNSALFLEEARELLAKIETVLISLESQPENLELVNEVFRCLHTIKGSGAMFGFSRVSDFSHIVENLFDELRKGRLHIDSRIVDIGLRAADSIRVLIDQPEAASDLTTLIGEIAAVCEPSASSTVSKPVTVASPSDSITASKSQAKGELAEGAANDMALPQVWRITFRPETDLLHRGAHLAPLFRELEALGTCHTVANTSRIPPLEALDPTALHVDWTITLSTSRNLAAIKSVFIFVEDYAKITYTPVKLEGEDGEPRTPRIGEILADRGLLAPAEIESIRNAQLPFGHLAVASGRVAQEHVDAALAEQSIVKSTNTEREAKRESSTIRVRKEKLDDLIDLVGELVILQAILEQESRQARRGEFVSLSENLSRLTADLRDTTMGIRMVPLEESFASFQRLVRDLSKSVGKPLRLEISGSSTELDKNLIEALKDPLLHIIRNSADHGIEAPAIRAAAGKPPEGTITLSACQAGSRVEITIADDGGGLDMERIRQCAIERKLLDPKDADPDRIQALIFEPGFSTSDHATGLSGRGVGMDVVKRNIKRLRGEVRLHSESGKGISITLSIPLTLVIIEGLLVRINGFDYVITLSQVQECVDMTPDIRIDGNDGRILNLRGQTIPVISVRESLGVKAAYQGKPRFVIVANENHCVGLMVDAVLGRKQVVIKPLSTNMRQIKIISGATILGDGSVALILDIAEIIKAKSEKLDVTQGGTR